ncbi:MAG: hypothetical protein H0W65_09490 [Sphingomonas sp.]|uniref:hypothetical protein n=1 Tax=Sphingomonas sp. TaxID=28214 RepID=UPI0017B08C4F|nr:hypothetical protein [Sphingomonas sp.]MBA3667941.1 hypothetical protein [Sphingomonas sp.]
MANDERWLAKPTNKFEEAFPNVEAIDFEVDNNPWGHYDTLGQNPMRITRASAKAHLGCPNRRCKEGGFAFGDLLSNYSLSGSGTLSVDQTYPCAGYEVKRTGRSNGRDCDNSFKVKGTITFKA